MKLQLSKQRYHNPVLQVPGRNQGDPAVLQFNGLYYLYHTDVRAIPVYTSRDLVHWEQAVTALEASQEDGHWAQIDLWAPEVIYDNGSFYMFVTAAKLGPDGAGDDQERHIGVAVSDSPLGPFRWQEQPLTVEWSIDAHPFRDRDGSWYLYYNVRNEYTRGPDDVIGTGNVVDRMINLTELAGNPTFVVKPTLPREGNKEGTFFWNEGPFVLEREGLYYQMYSAGCYADETYGMYYATSPVPMGRGGMLDNNWQKRHSSEVLLGSGETCHGPGHHVVVKGPNGVHDYVVYHGCVPGEDSGERRTYIDRMHWHQNELFIDGPGRDGDMPWRSGWEEDFADPAALRARWQVLAGEWDVAAGEGRVQREEISSVLLADVNSLHAYVWETHVRFAADAAGEAGIYAFYAGEDQYVETVISRECGEVVSRLVEDGEVTLQRKTKLRADVRYEVWHSLRAVKNDRLLQVYLDGLLVHTLDLRSDVAGRAGLVACGAEARYGYTSWLAHFEDNFVDLPVLWETVSVFAGVEADLFGACDTKYSQIVKGELVLHHHQEYLPYRPRGRGRMEESHMHMVVKGNELLHYEVKSDLQMLIAEHELSTSYGIVAAYLDPEHYLLVGVDVHFHRLCLWEHNPCGRQVLGAVPMPDDLNPERYHQIRCVKTDDEIRVFLNGRHLLTRQHGFAKPTRIGLFVQNGGAAFDNVAQTILG